MGVGLPANARVEPTAKSDPDTVTSVPPVAGPSAGVNDDIDGPAKVYRPTNVFQQVFALAQLVPVLPSVSSDTTHTSVGCSASCTAVE